MRARSTGIMLPWLTRSRSRASFWRWGQGWPASRALFHDTAGPALDVPSAALANVDEDVQAEILARTHIVESESDCIRIVDRLREAGQPIGMDMEGVHLKPLGMIQVRAFDRQIYLFRTARNPDLIARGGLKGMLEDPGILKIMHAATGDCLSIYNEGVKLWGLFDTALARKVIEYQCHGTSLFADLASFNLACSESGLDVNPMKNHMKGKLWTSDGAYTQPTLPLEFLLYSSFDVDPLLDLYHIYSSQIDVDFQPLFQYLCENELIRPIDEDLLKLRKTEIRQEYQSNIFLRHLHKSCNKGQLYSFLAPNSGLKRVQISESYQTAHVTAGDRQSALMIYKSLLDRNWSDTSCPDLKAKLMSPLLPDEIQSAQLSHERNLDQLREDNYIVDTKVMAELVDQIIQTRCPIVVDFTLTARKNVHLELFVGRCPNMKFMLDVESAKHGKLAELLASDKVVKVVPRIDALNVYEGLKICSNLGWRPRNFFELSSAYKSMDYWLHGHSIYQSASPAFRALISKYGLSVKNGLESSLLLYLHMTHQYPQPILDLLAAKAQIDLDVGANVNLAEAKEAKKLLRQKYETNMVHVECVRGYANDFQSEVTAFWADQCQKLTKPPIFLNKAALVEVKKHPDLVQVILTFNKAKARPKVKWYASKIELKTDLERKPLKHVERESMLRKTLSFVEDLEALGFYAKANLEGRNASQKPKLSFQDIVAGASFEMNQDSQSIKEH